MNNTITFMNGTENMAVNKGVIHGISIETGEDVLAPLVFFTDWNAVKDNITARLIDTKSNKEYLKDKICFRIEGTPLAVLPTIEMYGAYMPAPTGITDIWRIDPDALYKTAMVNTRRIHPLHIQSLAAVAEMFGDKEAVNTTTSMISTDSWTLGAIAVLFPSAEDQLKELYPNGYYLLPSSIHEMMAVPENLRTPSEWKKMVEEINESTVDPSEQLGSNIYQIKNGRLIIAA